VRRPEARGRRRRGGRERDIELPLRDAVKQKWLYGNAARVFGLE